MSKDTRASASAGTAVLSPLADATSAEALGHREFVLTRLYESA